MNITDARITEAEYFKDLFFTIDDAEEATGLAALHSQTPNNLPKSPVIILINGNPYAELEGDAPYTRISRTPKGKMDSQPTPKATLQLPTPNKQNIERQSKGQTTLHSPSSH